MAKRIIIRAGLPMVLRLSSVSAQQLPPLAKQLKLEETAIMFVDIQNNFAATDGEHYPRIKKFFDESKMLEISVALVKRGRRCACRLSTSRKLIPRIIKNSTGQTQATFTVVRFCASPGRWVHPCLLARIELYDATRKSYRIESTDNQCTSGNRTWLRVWQRFTTDSQRE